MICKVSTVHMSIFFTAFFLESIFCSWKELLTDKNRHNTMNCSLLIHFYVFPSSSLSNGISFYALSWNISHSSLCIHRNTHREGKRDIHFFFRLYVFIQFLHVFKFSSCEAMAFVQLDGFNASQKGILASHLFLFSLRSIKKINEWMRKIKGFFFGYKGMRIMEHEGRFLWRNIMIVFLQDGWMDVPDYLLIVEFVWTKLWIEVSGNIFVNEIFDRLTSVPGMLPND